MIATGTERTAQDLIANRQIAGFAKYKSTVADNTLTHREWLQHAAEEALDMAIYLLRAIEEIDKTQPANSQE